METSVTLSTLSLDQINNKIEAKEIDSRRYHTLGQQEVVNRILLQGIQIINSNLEQRI